MYVRTMTRARLVIAALTIGCGASPPPASATTSEREPPNDASTTSTQGPLPMTGAPVVFSFDGENGRCEASRGHENDPPVTVSLESCLSDTRFDGSRVCLPIEDLGWCPRGCGMGVAALGCQLGVATPSRADETSAEVPLAWNPCGGDEHSVGAFLAPTLARVRSCRPPALGGPPLARCGFDRSGACVELPPRD